MKAVRKDLLDHNLAAAMSTVGWEKVIHKDGTSSI